MFVRIGIFVIFGVLILATLSSAANLGDREGDKLTPEGTFDSSGEVGGSLGVPCESQMRSGYCGRTAVFEVIKYYKAKQLAGIDAEPGDPNICTVESPEEIKSSKGLASQLSLKTHMEWVIGDDYTQSQQLIQTSIANGHPVIFYTGLYYGGSASKPGHIMTVSGYDTNTDEYTLNNSSVDDCETIKATMDSLQYQTKYGKYGRHNGKGHFHFIYYSGYQTPLE